MAKDLRVALFNAIKLHLQTTMPELQGFIDEFPEPNEKLKFPCVSISTNEPPFVACAPYIFTKDETVDNRANVRYVIGQRELKYQFDFWCGSKAERDRISRSFLESMSSQFPVMGVTLDLPDYFGSKARLDYEQQRFEDAEIGAQRREWRLIATVTGNCLEIIERVEHMIVTTEVETDVLFNEIVLE